MGIFLCKNAFIGELFWHFRIYGYDFQKILQIYGWYFYDLNGTTPYLGNSSYPPPHSGISAIVCMRFSTSSVSPGAERRGGVNSHFREIRTD